MSIMGAVSRVERELKSERAAAEREAAKARGKTGGRPRIEPKKLEQARILYENSDQTAAEVCQTWEWERGLSSAILSRNEWG